MVVVVIDGWPVSQVSSHSPVHDPVCPFHYGTAVVRVSVVKNETGVSQQKTEA